MSTGFPHLTPNTAQQLELSEEDRIEAVLKDTWIGYTRANEVIDRWKDLYRYPNRLRMPGLIIAGETNNGKTRLLHRFRDLHPPKGMPDGSPDVPVILVGMPSEPNESRFWGEVLGALKICHKDTDSVQSKQGQAYDILRYKHVKTVVIDEIHNLLNGSPRQQKHFLAVVKNLSNQMSVQIVVAGTRDAIRAIHIDPQLANRFEAKGLQTWKLDKEFRRLIYSFESLLPLPEPSGLADKPLLERIYMLSDGTIGAISDLLKTACILAIRGGKSRITDSTFNEIAAARQRDKL